MHFCGSISFSMDITFLKRTQIERQNPHSQLFTPPLFYYIAKPLCGINVVCTATFLVQVAAPVPGTPSSSSSAISAPTATATTNGTAPSPTPKPATGGSNGIYTIGSADLTSQLLAKYNQDHCPKSAANAKMATSVVAMVAVASIVSFVSALL